MSGPRTDWDAVVVGAGPNGLVAANLLLDAGWRVLVLEAQPEVGGAVRSARDLDPDFVHDTCSAFYPLAAASPTMVGLRLEEHGLTWRRAPAVLGHQLLSGGTDAEATWAVLEEDPHDTAAGLEALHPGDGEAWLELCGTWDRIGPTLIDALLTPFPPLRPGISALARLRSVGGLTFVREMLMPVDGLGRSRFHGEAPRALLAGNAGHADIPLDAPGSGFMGVLLCMLGQTVGFPVPEGGAGALAAALRRRLESRGGAVRTEVEVVGIDVDRGRATGVRTADGSREVARRAVIADVSALALYGRLVAAEHLPGRTRRAMRSFELDPGTVKVDWALDGPVPWRSAPARAPGTVHVADSVTDMVRSLSQVNSGVLPEHPFMLTGQMTTSDPTRSPVGTESFWAYTHVPQDQVQDAGEDGAQDGGRVRGVWDRDDCERFADRMQARLERAAPGFGSRVRSRRVLGPRELEGLDANLVGGAVNGGTSQLHQQLVFRPVPGLGRAETPVASLYLASASAHPGGGVHGAPGSNAARAALLHSRVPWGGGSPRLPTGLTGLADRLTRGTGRP